MPGVHPEVLPADLPRRRKLVHLQILRAVAASLVVVDHALDALVDRGALPVRWTEIGYHLGWMGVGMFFVTSGLIMFRTAGDSYGSTASARQFAARRIVRVVPMYWIATLIVAAIQRGPDLPVRLLKSLLFIPYTEPGADVMRPVLGVGWTLNYEMFFYLLFAVSLLLPRRIGLPALLSVLVGLVAVGGLLHPLLDYRDPTTLADFYTDPLLMLFAGGMVLGWAEARWPDLPTVRFPLAGACVPIAAAVLLFAAVGVRFPLPLGWQALFGALCVVAVAACTWTRDNPPVTPWSLALERAGDASYSTYLFHVLLVGAAAVVWFRLPLPHDSPGLAVLFIAGVVVAANVVGWLIFVVAERRITRFLRRVTVAQVRSP